MGKPLEDGLALVISNTPRRERGLGRRLRRVGYLVYEVSNTDAGIEALWRLPFSLVATDISLSGALTGLQFAEHVRHHFPGMPVILQMMETDDQAIDGAEKFPILRKIT